MWPFNRHKKEDAACDAPNPPRARAVAGFATGRDCGYWEFFTTERGALVVAQRACEGEWLSSVDLLPNIPTPMKFYKVSHGNPAEYIPPSLISGNLFEILARCTKGAALSVPAVIETVKGDEEWKEYRFFKAPPQITHHDLWSGKGTGPIYTIFDAEPAAIVVSSKVRACMEIESGNLLHFSTPSRFGSGDSTAGP